MTKQEEALIEEHGASIRWQNDNSRIPAHSAHGFSIELFRSAFEHAAVGMAFGASDGKWLKVNRHFCDIAGYDSAELINRSIQEITHPEDVEEDNRLLHALYLLKIPSFSREKRYLHKNGTYIWVNETVSLAPDGKGTPHHICIIEDVTRRRFADRALRRSMRSLQGAYGVPLSGTWNWNIHTNEFTWSTEIYHIFGTTPLNVGACLRQVHPDDLGAVKRAFKRGLEGRPVNIEFRIIVANSSERIVHMQGAAAFDMRGLLSRISGTVQDITDYKLNDNLRESRTRLEGISSNIPCMVFQLEQIGDALAFNYVSDGSNDVCGMTAERICTDPRVFLDLIHREDRAAFHESKERSKESLTLWNWEGRLALANEWTKWVNLRATPRRIGATITMWDGVMFNISQSKKNEAEIEQSREMLRALSVHQMAAKEEEGKRIAREIHDELGQRLTVLRMDVMMLPKVTGEQSAPLTEAAGRMKDTIDGILRIVRDISSHLRPAALDIGLVLAVEWLLDDFQTSLGIPCNFTNKIDESVVLDDERATGIFRILQESITNVARHANATRIDVSLEIIGEHLHLLVKDDGVGYEAKRRNNQATFGLRGMRERALAIGGETSILSSPGGGTTVFASIPLVSK